MVEARPVHIVHVVEHPDEIPDPPRIGAVDERLAGFGGDIAAAIVFIREIDSPHRPRKIPRLPDGLLKERDLPPRSLVVICRTVDPRCEPLIDRHRNTGWRSTGLTSEVQSLMHTS